MRGATRSTSPLSTAGASGRILAATFGFDILVARSSDGFPVRLGKVFRSLAGSDGAVDIPRLILVDSVDIGMGRRFRGLAHDLLQSPGKQAVLAAVSRSLRTAQIFFDKANFFQRAAEPRTRCVVLLFG